MGICIDREAFSLYAIDAERRCKHSIYPDRELADVNVWKRRPIANLVNYCSRND
jgi:hypothetical protein